MLKLFSYFNKSLHEWYLDLQKSIRVHPGSAQCEMKVLRPIECSSTSTSSSQVVTAGSSWVLLISVPTLLLNLLFFQLLTVYVKTYGTCLERSEDGLVLVVEVEVDRPGKLKLWLNSSKVLWPYHYESIYCLKAKKYTCIYFIRAIYKN